MPAPKTKPLLRWVRGWNSSWRSFMVCEKFVAVESTDIVAVESTDKWNALQSKQKPLFD
jgi:hypothetical protein